MNLLKAIFAGAVIFSLASCENPVATNFSQIEDDNGYCVIIMRTVAWTENIITEIEWVDTEFTTHKCSNPQAHISYLNGEVNKLNLIGKNHMTEAPQILTERWETIPLAGDPPKGTTKIGAEYAPGFGGDMSIAYTFLSWF